MNEYEIVIEKINKLLSFTDLMVGEKKVEWKKDINDIKDFIEKQSCIDNFVVQKSPIDMLCGYFDHDNSTSSATKCKCGREKWEHPIKKN